LRTINFARYLAGLPADVVTTPALNSQAQHGAVLLAASIYSHSPPRPADMPQPFFEAGLRSTSSSNIGAKFNTSVAFQRACLADEDERNIARVGHRRWLLNPPMRQTGIGVASGYMTTHAFDRSRTGTVDYDQILWPAEGLFPVEFMTPRTPWSITLNPAKYDWDEAGPHRVTLRRISDGQIWTLDAATKNPKGAYFNADFTRFGVGNAFIFRPNPATISYNPGDEFEVTLSGNIFAERTRTPVTVTYRTRFMTLCGSGSRPPAVRSTRNVAGPDRIGTAVEASKLAFPGGAATVVIATASNWPDALGGAALAGALDAPLLLTETAKLSPATATEITRLRATRVVILGGEGAVSPVAEQQLVAKLRDPDRVTRIHGINRFETSRKIAAETVALLQTTPGGYDGTAFVATGANFPDALSASPLAAANGWPIYLVDPRGLDAATVAAMRDAGVSRTVILGGTSAVPAATATSLSTQVAATTMRLGGADRYITAHAVAVFGVREGGLSWRSVAIATGTNFPDALAGGVLQGRHGSVLLLTPSNALHFSTRNALEANRWSIHEARFLGGEAAISRTVRSGVSSTLR